MFQCPVTDIYEDRENVYVVMEQVAGGELFTRFVWKKLIELKIYTTLKNVREL